MALFNIKALHITSTKARPNHVITPPSLLRHNNPVVSSQFFFLIAINEVNRALRGRVCVRARGTKVLGAVFVYMHFMESTAHSALWMLARCITGVWLSNRQCSLVFLRKRCSLINPWSVFLSVCGRQFFASCHKQECRASPFCKFKVMSRKIKTGLYL